MWTRLKNKYKKGGDAGSKGVRFQVNLLTLFLLKAMCNLKNWKLSTENQNAGKFDDIVLECLDEAVLLQAKHKDNKNKITLNDLLSANTKKDDFSLPKYFLSYQEIKHRFKVKNVIVCTNANFDKNTFIFINSKKASPESMLYYEADNCIAYTFNYNILHDLKKNTNVYLKQCKNKKINESVINDENLKDFLDHLQFYFNYPSGDDMENIIERQLSVVKDISNFCNKACLTDIHSKMMNWFQQKDGEYLTEIHANAMFLEISRDKYWQKLDQYNVFFQKNNLKIDSPTKIFHIVSEDEFLLREIQVYRTLRDIKNVLCAPSESDVEELKAILKVFELPKYTFICIIWSKLIEESFVYEVTSKLKEILSNTNYKKLILITGNNNLLARQYQLKNLSHDVIYHSVTFNDLLEETQNNLSKRRIINFQGVTVNLEELFASKTTGDYRAALNSEILEKLIRNEEVTVGSRVHPLDPDIERLYISRTFIRNDEEVEECNIFEVDEKVILIADGPGMGKSTVLTNLAITIKKKYPHLWVIKIVLTDYTRILNLFLHQNRKSVSTSELLDSQVETRLTHQLEKYLFSVNNSVVLMLDGVDEISPSYTELVENLIVHCRQAQNFAKVVVTSRPHVTEQLENKLNVKSFTLQSFTKQNQVDYLTNYWAHNLGLSDTNKAKCKRYAEALLSQIWYFKNDYYLGESHFASIPLQVRMLAEIFQERTRSENFLTWEGCKEYLETKETVPSLPKINFAKLFKMFVDKKRSVYVEKLNPSGNAMADPLIKKQFDACLEYHRAQALELILNKDKYELFTNYKKNNNNVENEIFNIGIIQKIGSRSHFIHRTFAEYFVAECLIRELQSQHQNVEFQKFLLDEVLQRDDYSGICAFFDSFLEEVLDSLPINAFKAYQCSTVNMNENLFFLIHYLAEKGYVAIFQLILKSFDFAVIRPISFKEFTIFREREIFSLFDQIDFNIRYENGGTLLDRAVDKGRIDMVTFLGSKIYSKPANHNADLPLCRIVYFDVEQFLVSSIKPNSVSDYRILYRAVFRNYDSIAEYLLEKIMEVDKSATNDSLVTYTAAYLGRLDILEPLLRESGVVDVRIPNGETLLFGAARGGRVDVVQYLADHGANINSIDDKGNTALHIISASSSLTFTVKLLIDLEIDINFRNFNKRETALHIAAAEGNIDVVHLLIKSGAVVDTEDTLYGVNALDYDVDWDDLYDTINIEETQYDVNDLDYNIGSAIFNVGQWGRLNNTINTEDTLYGVNALHYAVGRGHLNIVKLLIQNGASVNMKVYSGFNTLDTAVAHGRLDIIKYLLKARNNVAVNLKGHSGYRALRIAIDNYKLHVVQFLLEFGVDVNTKNSGEYPILHSAVKSYQFSTIKLLIEYDIDLNVTDQDGNTALHVVANLYVSVYMFKLLVDSGINLNVRNKYGHTALHIFLNTYGSNCLPQVNDLDIDTYDKGLEAMSEADMVERWKANCYKMSNNDIMDLSLLAACLTSIIFLIKSGTDINLRDSDGNTVASLIEEKGGQLLMKHLNLKSSEEKIPT